MIDMMKTLSQIVTTFLAVGATFVAAYLIYLYSSQANIDEKIQIKGSKIVSLIKKAPTYKLGLWSNNLALVNNYKEKYPRKSLIFIYERISEELSTTILNVQKVSNSILKSFAKDNSPGPILGRIYLDLMENSVDYLSPSEIWWPGRGLVKARSSLAPTPKQAELFPFGPLGVEKWSDDFRFIRNYTNSLYRLKHKFLNDINRFVDQSDEKERYKNVNFKEWINNIENLLSNIENENYHIQSLLRLKQRYSRETRLPNICWITTLGILSFISGVAVPLIIIGLKGDNPIPPTFNIVILITAFTFLIGSTVLIGRDVLPSYMSEAHIKYLFPLKNQLLDYKKSRMQIEYYDYDIVNQLLDEKKYLKLPPKLFNSLEKYQKMVIESNASIESVIGLISQNINKSKVLRSYKADPQSGGQWVNIISLLSLDGRKKFLENLKKGSNTFILMISYQAGTGTTGIGTKTIYKIKLPSNETHLEKIESEFNKIFDNCLKQENVKSYILKRKTLEKYRNKLLIQIIKITGK